MTKADIVWQWITAAREAAALSTLLSTREGRRQVAAWMVNPVRCGGLDYGKV